MAPTRAGESSTKRRWVYRVIILSLGGLMVASTALVLRVPRLRVHLCMDPDPHTYSRWRDPNPQTPSVTGLSPEQRTRLIHDLYMCKSRTWGSWVHGSLYFRKGYIHSQLHVERMIRVKKDRLLHEAVADAAVNHDFEAVREVCREILDHYPYRGDQ